MDNKIGRFITNLSKISTIKLGERINCSYQTEEYYFEIQRKTEEDQEYKENAKKTLL